MAVRAKPSENSVRAGANTYAVRMPDTTSAPLVHLGPLTPRLEVLDAEDRRAVFLNGHLVARLRV